MDRHTQEQLSKELAKRNEVKEGYKTLEERIYEMERSLEYYREKLETVMKKYWDAKMEHEYATRHRPIMAITIKTPTAELEEWSQYRSDNGTIHLIGTCYGHREIKDGTCIQTTPVRYFDKDLKVAVTTNTVYFLKGNPTHGSDTVTF